MPRKPLQPELPLEKHPKTQTTLEELRLAALQCQACDLYKGATQTVPGVGPPGARLMLVGEQPGNDEDLAGQPFVGPAGKVLDRALEAAGIARDTVFVTNAVKHFKYQLQGKRRIHQKPNVTETRTCKMWLDAEIRLINPSLLVCLGATAAQAIFGAAFRITQQRGEVLPSPVGQVLATYHPSAILRAPDESARDAMFNDLVHDLQTAAQYIAKPN